MTKKNFKLKASALGVAISGCIILSACGAGNAGSSSEIGKTEKTNRVVTVERCGEKTQYKGVPGHIIATAPGVTDTLFDLGLGPKLKGVGSVKTGGPTDKYADPYEKLIKLGSNDFGSKEQILSSGADFVFAEHSDWAFDTSQGRASKKELESAGMQIYYSKQGCGKFGGPISSLYEDIFVLGKIFDKEENAKQLVGTLKQKVSRAKEKVSKRKFKIAILGFDPAGNNMAAIGPKYVQGELLRELGQANVFANLAKDKTFVSVTPEAVIAENPDIIFVTTTSKEVGTQKLKMAAEKFGQTNAVKKKAFYVLEDMGGQPGSTRQITQLEYIAQKIASMSERNV